MSEFAFIPRKLTKTSKKVSTQQENLPVAGPSRLPIVDKDNFASKEIKLLKDSILESRTEKFLSDNAYATLLKLTLSEYSISSDLELKQRLLHGDNDCFVPLSYLMNMRPLSSYMTPCPTETVLIRSIRTFAADHIEARMIISAPNVNVWSTSTSGFDIQGGYEVRRKDWKNAVCRNAWQLSRSYWESRTIYIENLLPNVRTVPAIAKLIEDVLAQKSTSSTRYPLQGINFPPHYNDPPNSLMASTSKGFAFVVFTTYEDTIIFLEEWPWDVKNRHVRANSDGNIKASLHNCGFRSIAKSRWESLKEEYMTRKQDLLAHVISDSQKPVSNDRELSSSISQETSLAPGHKNGTFISQTESSSPPDYPLDCLVFVKNIHPGCNKTTLRQLLCTAFDGVVDYINYVDYNKGMDSCYIRLAAPQYSKALVGYFASNHLTQKDGLDGHGSNELSKDSSPIQAELIQGKRENIYWERVPTKIKQQALSLAQTKSSESMLPDENKQRKKRKHR